MGSTSPAPGKGDTHRPSTASRLNRLRAGVLGANDGIVSVAGVVIGMAATTPSTPVIATAGFASLVAGALSMAAGEYVSVSTQRDTEAALLQTEGREIEQDPQGARDELAATYRDKGLSPELADQVAAQLSANGALAAHADAELNIDPQDLTNPWEAAIASLLSFTVGGLLPMAAILLVPAGLRILVTFMAVAVALVATGWASAHLGGAPTLRATVRTVIGGALAMVVTYTIGSAVDIKF